jgi:H+-transporting ATPase
MEQFGSLPIERPVATGLTNDEVQQRRAVYGPNTVVEQTPPPWRIFVGKFSSPIAWMLGVAAVVEIAIGAYAEAGVIATLLLFNAALGFIQESRATAALAALKQRLALTALVLRDGAWVKLPASEIVPGDTVRLPLGALVPADTRVISGAVMVDQSMLTGESVPVDANPGSTIYAGSLVRRGQAVAEVTATGAKTYFGRAAELVRVAHARSTEQSAVFAVTRNLAMLNGLVALLIVVYAHHISVPSAELIRLALTALLATIPAALPATFTLSSAIAAQMLAHRGVLLTRLSAAHEAAAMDVLCSDKTGTLTRNALEVVEVLAMPGTDRERVLGLAALASSEGDQDPIDSAIQNAASGHAAAERATRFVPFDPATKIAEASVVDTDGNESRIIKGAFEIVSRLAEVPKNARALVDGLAGQGHRVIAVATGQAASMRLLGLIAISDPAREDSAGLVNELGKLGVRTVMVTGDSATTATAIAAKVGIAGTTYPTGHVSDDLDADKFSVFARVAPDDKYHLVKALQKRGHVVGMCGDGTNDAPALRQAQIGIAVSTATDVAKAAAGMVMTEPGLVGIVFAVREGRTVFQRLVTYTFNMLIKKVEVVLFLATGLVMTGQSVMTPVLMVLMLATNDFLAMSLTTDRASFASSPSIWRMGNITAGALLLGICKLGFSTAVLALGKFRLGLSQSELQTLALVILVFGSQALLYVVRERKRLWSSKPGIWVVAASAADIGIVSVLALSGTLMAPVSWQVLAMVLAAASGFALVLDQIKRPIIAAFRIE